MMKLFRAAIAALAFFASVAAISPAKAQFTDQATGIFTTTGSANAYLVSIPNVNSLADALAVKFTISPNFTNTTSATINVSSTGVKNLMKPGPAGLVTLTGNELIIGQPAMIQYDGTQYVILSSINSTASTLFVSPQGYLTPCQVSSGSPVSGCTAGVLLPTGDVTAATALYYVPYYGNQVPIWNGTQYVVFQISELTLILGSSNLANTVYDVCVFSNSGVETLVTSVAWTTSTAGSGARGTGAGTAQISLINGLFVNTVAISGKNGASTYSISANQCTILGSILVDGTNGQVSFTRTFGQNRKWAAWNFYNQQDIKLQGGDTTASWSYSTSTWRQSNGAAGNNVKFFTGLPVQIAATFTQQVKPVVNNNQCVAQVGIGWNSTTAPSGSTGIVGVVSTTSVQQWGNAVANYVPSTNFGLNQANTLEIGAITGGGGCQFFGSSDGMGLLGSYRG